MAHVRTVPTMTTFAAAQLVWPKLPRWPVGGHVDPATDRLRDAERLRDTDLAIIQEAENHSLHDLSPSEREQLLSLLRRIDFEPTTDSLTSEKSRSALRFLCMKGIPITVSVMP